MSESWDPTVLSGVSASACSILFVDFLKSTVSSSSFDEKTPPSSWKGNERMRSTLSRFLLAICLAAILGACGTLGGRFGGGGGTDTEAMESTSAVALDAEAARAALRDVVASHVERSTQGGGAERSQVVRSKPYYFKEYAEYPADALSIMAVELQETESRTGPFRAEVTLPKTRYATRLHRSRNSASSDGEFIRQTGRETLNLVLRSGRWKVLGSAFVADRTEMATGGVWQEADEAAAASVVVEPERQGWFTRQWSKVFGE
jgi:hypothetical protein